MLNQLRASTCLLASSMALLYGCTHTTLSGSAPSEASVGAHVASATRAAGSDLGELLTLCQPAPATRPESGPRQDEALKALIAKPAPPPGRAFDQLYFLGGDWASAWAITTSEGIILIDALNNQVEAAALIEGGMRTLGLDPARIKYIVVTHGHGDHYGGAPYLAQKYGARVVMSDVDWSMMETQLEFASPVWGPAPKRDVSVKDGDRITLGDTTIMMRVTAGHTPGTLSPVFDVSWAGEKHRAVLWGGIGFNFGKDMSRLNAYVDSTSRMSALAQTEGIDVYLSNHSRLDGSQARLAALHQNPAPQANPFVIGTPDVRRSLSVMNECAQAQRDRFALQP